MAPVSLAPETKRAVALRATVPLWITAITLFLFGASVLVCHDDEFTSPQKWITRAACPFFRSRAARAAFTSRICYHPQFANLHKVLSQNKIPQALHVVRPRGTNFFYVSSRLTPRPSYLSLRAIVLP